LYKKVLVKNQWLRLSDRSRKDYNRYNIIHAKSLICGRKEKQMKKRIFCRTLIAVIAIAMLFTFSSTAFAAVTLDSSWNGSCYNQFTCSQSLYDGNDANWYMLLVNSHNIDFSYGSYDKKLKAYGKTTTGYRMTDDLEVWEKPYNPDGFSCYTQKPVHSYQSYDEIKLVVKNPYSGPQMTSQGHFCGAYTF
jgi:hypothetical protein